jgi:hypothetical protein
LAAKLLWKSLRPAPSNGCVIVDEYKGTVIDGVALENGFDEHKSFAILIARRIRDLII